MTPRQVNAKRKREGLPPLNFRLFRAVIKKLETAPMAYEQDTVVSPDRDAPCGTAACIGGWAYLLEGQRATTTLADERVLNKAAFLLGLNEDDQSWSDGDAGSVFSSSPESRWPAPFGGDWMEADGREEEAKVAVRYLKNILATGDVGTEG